MIILRNIQIIIEYDGTNYVGWQIQKNGLSIQEVIESSLKMALGEKIKLVGSSRTDSGVHAYGQSANFFTDCGIPSDRIPYALNTHLPKDIRIVHAYEKPMEFHSRYDARGKVYLYKVLCSQHASALERHRVWHIKSSVNINNIQDALPYFIGTMDFTAFSSTHTHTKNRVRTVRRLEMERIGGSMLFTIEGDGFLYNMVRIIIGTIMDIGLCKFQTKDIPDMIQNKDRNKTGKTAPAQGLYLKEVLY
ncbi:MAG: tRNA pseudouridine(38-40) synthase TruA [Eubacteriales bacterium]